MKNLLIALGIGLVFVIEGCDLLGGGDTPIVTPQSPVFIQATPFPSVVEFNGSSVFKYEVLYAKYVEINGVRYSNNKGSIEFNKLTISTPVTIIAFGEKSSISDTVTIVVKDRVPAPKVTVTAPMDSISFGERATFSWTIDGEYTRITVDSVVQIGDTFTTEALYSSKEFRLTVTGPGGSTSTNIKVLVGDWATSKIGLLTHKLLVEESDGFYVDGILVSSVPVTKEQKAITRLYTIKGDLISTDFDGSKYVTKWEFVGDNHIRFISPINNSVYSEYLIVSLTKDELILSSPNTWYGKPAEVRTRYVHP